MQQEEKDYLEIEAKSCELTANQLCNNDNYINTKTKKIVDMLRDRAKKIREQLKND